MDRKAFFAALRRRESGVFGTSLSQAQVDGIEAILDSCRRNRVTDPHHVANILAQVMHETGGYMSPIKETVYASHRDKSPSDATVIARLDRAYAKGQLPWVSSPYWRDGWFGRGMVQLTHEANYAAMGRRLNRSLVANPDLALEPSISADIAVVGMKEGMFTGKKLSDFDFPDALENVPSRNPRRIVNGKDGTDAKVAGYHRAFFDALMAGGWEIKPHVPDPQPQPDPIPSPDPADGAGNGQSPSGSKRGAGLVALVVALGAAVAAGWEWIGGLFQ